MQAPIVLGEVAAPASLELRDHLVAAADADGVAAQRARSRCDVDAEVADDVLREAGADAARELEVPRPGVAAERLFDLEPCRDRVERCATVNGNGSGNGGDRRRRSGAAAPYDGSFLSRDSSRCVGPNCQSSNAVETVLGE